ncbi:A/G-specific adenine glycosylase [Sphingomonas sp. Leaf407]|uniref:A/G-specific adenine glycosylase n=1 Tax=unclassified Sphingomonas TaxID=196159 RepID=UPI0006FBDD6D|nr:MULTISPECIES: A/G-specific adenine glycosylase [unclassified Sphingomonas]KQN35564.1 A/G-specific adenine glycosylase [Sphingomonas sp. Leaf42]KQT26431.1 A/G-specific adenine glycosylase [Sphingomonas sp. Leaf407]
MDAKHLSVADLLLDWYDRHHRSLPWRSPPGSPPPDPYRVWLSEVMLQQTQVATVRPYFEGWSARWPSFAALAAADDGEVMAAWAGLGYYARARNLLKCARVVAALGHLPDSESELRKLPGIGDYTAAAIAAIAFARRAVVVDANVERVVSRLFAIAQPLPGARPAIRAATDSITPDARAGDFAQGMMDLGSGVCTARSPKCLLCPLRMACAAHAAGTPDAYPVKAAKKAKPQRHGTLFWAERDGAVLLVRRPDKGMLGGMRALPTGPWEDVPPGTAGAPFEGAWRTVGVVHHGFTHFDLACTVMVADAAPEGLDGEWWPVAAIADAGLPTLFARAVPLVEGMRC